MEKHVKLVGILNIVYHSIGMFGALVLAALAAAFGGLMEAFIQRGYIDPMEVPTEVFNIVPVILLFAAAGLAALSIAGIVGGIGLINRREWGRITVLVVSFLDLARIPLGTVLGIYSIWALLNNESIKLFTPETSVVAAQPAV